MSREEAKALVYSDIDHMRLVTCEIAEDFHARSPGLDRWISRASKKELLAELLALFSSNNKGGNEPF
jgi:hypothetical protein